MRWFRRMMIGRYGSDQLSIALLVLYMVLSFTLQFTGLYFLRLVSFIPMALCFYRMLSRNINKRYAENMRFLKRWNPIKAWFVKAAKRMKDMRTYKYYKCPNCSNTLRVPRGRGKICITCPVCKTDFIKKT